jgi:putative tryptophan/tyrosine transport system substrate-binding protein
MIVSRREGALNRREFISLLGAAVAWPLGARAQEPARVYRLGSLSHSSKRNSPPTVAFFEGMRQYGFIEG